MVEGHQPPHPLGEVVTDEFAFPLPSSVAPIPGAEASDDMYPYFTKFRPQDDRRFWFSNAMHVPDPVPDVVLSRVTKKVTSRTAAVVMLRHRPDRAGGGVLDEPIPDERRRQPSMGDDELRALLALAVQVELHYGRPMDIEWAVDAVDGSLALLQARPETVRSGRAATAPAAPKAHAFDHVVAMMGTTARIGVERRP